MTLMRFGKGLPGRGEVKRFAEALARLFHGEFIRLSSWGQSSPYLLTLQLPDSQRRITLDLGTTVSHVHEALEAVMELLIRAKLIAASLNSDFLCLPVPDQKPRGAVGRMTKR